MKKIWIKMLPIFLIILTISVIIKNDNNTLVANFLQENRLETITKKILKENEDKKINVNKSFDNKFTYLEFESNDKITSFFIDEETGEEVDFKVFLKEGREDDFFSKLNELTYLKYPKFIADVLTLQETKKIYQIKENELIIYFDNYIIEPAINEKLFVKVNYNEIKDYLDFSFILDSEYTNEDGYVYDKTKKTIALTFDDGPSGAKTDRIVEILENNKAHATFFMVGNKMNYGASSINNVLAKGNEIGSHTYAHKNMKRQKINTLIKDEAKTNEIYKNITGQDLIYTRPPYGAINKKVKEGLDTIFITWSLDTEDWLHRDKQYIVDYVMENISDGDIILMHDLYDSTVEAVEELLPKLYASGYQVVSVTELANLKGRILEKNNIYRSLKEIQ